MRQYFVVGLVVVAPLGATIFVLAWAFRTIDAILGRPLEQALGVRVPGLGFGILGLVVVLVGWAVQYAVGRRLVQTWNTALSRLPLTRRIYNAGSQIVQAMLAGDRPVFSRAVLVPYPTEGSWAVGFVTNEHTAILSEVVGRPCLVAFVPTTFSVPPSGYLLIFPTTQVRPLDLSVEDAFKFVVSAGAVLPTGASPAAGLDLTRLLERES